MSALALGRATPAPPRASDGALRATARDALKMGGVPVGWDSENDCEVTRSPKMSRFLMAVRSLWEVFSPEVGSHDKDSETIKGRATPASKLEVGNARSVGHVGVAESG